MPHQPTPISLQEKGVQLDMWSADQIAQYYANYAMQYETDINENAHTYPTPFVLGRWCVEHMLNEFRDLEYGDQPRVLRVLDLGCGTGQSCAEFLEHQKRDGRFRYELLGMDATPEMLSVAMARGVDSQVHDLECYPYPECIKEGAFDLIVCVGVMEFIHNPLGFLSYARRFLRRKQNHLTRMAVTLPERHAHSELSSFSRAEMEALVRQSGFYVERHECCVGYVDSQSGLVQMYHAYLLSPNDTVL